MNKREDNAVATFQSGYNCAQSVLSSFEDMLPLEREKLLSITAGFGGGMGKMQKTCGAVTGALMILSMYASGEQSEPDKAKELANKLVKEFFERFASEQGSTNCRELLGIDMNTEEGQRVSKEKNLFGTVCPSAVSTAVRLVESIILSDEAPTNG